MVVAKDISNENKILCKLLSTLNTAQPIFQKWKDLWSGNINHHLSKVFRSEHWKQHPVTFWSSLKPLITTIAMLGLDRRSGCVGFEHLMQNLKIVKKQNRQNRN